MLPLTVLMSFKVVLPAVCSVKPAPPVESCKTEGPANRLFIETAPAVFTRRFAVFTDIGLFPPIAPLTALRTMLSGAVSVPTTVMAPLDAAERFILCAINAAAD